jgi:hypothetical protein
MDTQTFMAEAERILATTPFDKISAVRDALMTQARSEFGDDIADEINDALADSPKSLV